ncbi:MAG: hypothetical protein JOZ97_00265 [Candidatus Eremiobacteraeota bacterium]|nr:hypothetical protein [Candidatus Eremiobacteraeota bacterium]
MSGTAIALTAPLHPAPPGMIDRQMTVYLAGEAMNSRYQVVASRLRLTNSDWQPYLTIYAQRGDGFSQIYQSPSKTDPLALVPVRQKMPSGGPYLPTVTLSLIGKGEFMGGGRQQAAVLVHEAAADCGSSTLSILRSDPGPGPIRLAAQVSNPCDLSAHVQGNTIVLGGPYYNANAALCCPTQAHARAILSYGKGRWTLHPAYFKLTVRGMARARIIGPIPKMTPSPASIIKSPLPSPGALQTPRP